MSRKLLFGIIVVLLILLVSVTVYSLDSYRDINSELQSVQRQHDKYVSDADYLLKKSGHFSASEDWSSRSHAEVVGRKGATACFDCHDEVSCSNCHTKKDEQAKRDPDSRKVPEDVTRLIAQLRDRGYECTPTSPGNPDWLFSDVPAAYLFVEGSSVTVWQFESEKAAQDAMSNIGWDGTVLKQMGESSMGMKDGMNYPSPPHYFRSGRLVILYFALSDDRESGRDLKVLEALTTVAGKQVAGD